jgi:hypothetical protein
VGKKPKKALNMGILRAHFGVLKVGRKWANGHKKWPKTPFQPLKPHRLDTNLFKAQIKVGKSPFLN